MKRYLRLYTVTFLILSMLFLTACGNSPNSTGTASQTSSASGSAASAASDSSPAEEDLSKLPEIEFTFFMPDSNTKVAPDDAPILQQVYDATKVRIKKITPPAEARDRLNIMLATDDLPDLIRFWDTPLMNQFIKAGKVLKLNDLMEKYAPNTLNVNWKELRSKIADKDGNLWYMPELYRLPGVEGFIEGNVGFAMRTNLLEEKGWYQPQTFEDYYNLLKEVKAKYPGMSPMALALGPQGHLDALNIIAAGAYGLIYDESRTVLKDDKVVYFSELPEFKEFYRFLNKLYREGLMDKESVVMSSDMLKTKTAGGKVWSFLGWGWEIASEVIAYEAGKGSKEQMFWWIFPAADSSITKRTYVPYTRDLYTNGTVITTKCKDPERFMKFYEYMNTEEGFMKQAGIVNWDFKGENTVETSKDYDLLVRQDVQYIPGKPYVEYSEWMTKSWADDENFWVNRGLEYLGAFTYDGYSGTHPNGKYDLLGEQDVGIWWDENTKRVNGGFGWTGTNYFDKMKEVSVDKSMIAELPIDPESEEYSIEVKIGEYLKIQLPRIIVARDEAEFNKSWDEMNSKLKAEGMGKVIETRNRLYQERKQMWSK